MNMSGEKRAYVGTVVTLTRVITNGPICYKYICLYWTENGY